MQKALLFCFVLLSVACNNGQPFIKGKTAYFKVTNNTTTDLDFTISVDYTPVITLKLQPLKSGDSTNFNLDLGEFSEGGYRLVYLLKGETEKRTQKFGYFSGAQWEDYTAIAIKDTCITISAVR